MTVLLAGCGKKVPDTPSFTFQQSGVEDLFVSSDEPSLPDTISETSEIPGFSETQKRVLSYDPINQKTIEISGKTVTVSGMTSDVLIDHMSVFPKGAKCELNSIEGGFLARIALTEPLNGYLTVSLVYKDEHFDEFLLKVTPDGFGFWELPEIERSNENVVKNALEQPRDQVAEYIVKGGDPDEVRSVLNDIKTLSDEICEGLTGDYDKLRAISRWVSANIYYDYPAYDNGVPAETLSLKYMLESHSSVCGGYSNMTSALCAAQGIKCWNVHGSVLTGGKTFVDDDDSEYHEWNYAEIDGRIIWVDSGWNSFCYLSRGGDYNNGGICYRYFDIGDEYLALNHKANYAEYRDYFALTE